MELAAGRQTPAEVKTQRSIFQGDLLSLILFVIGGARGVMVIVVGKGHGDTSSNPG